MPENESTTSPQPVSPTDAAPASTPPQGGDSAKIESTGFKWGDEAPQYLRGKGAAETLDVVNRLASVVQQLAAQQPQHVQPTQPVQMSQPVEQLDDDLLVTNPAEWRRRFQAQQENTMYNAMSQAAAPVYQNMADTAAVLARQDAANADALPYWDEVDAVVSNIPYHLRTKAVYDQAAKLAKSNHVDEIASARAKAMAAAGTGIEGVTRTNIDGTVTTSADDATWDKIKATPMGQRMIDQYGKGKVLEVAKKMGGLEAYADMISKSKTTFDPMTPGRWNSELA